jgi:acetoacetate decarboxylase
MPGADLGLPVLEEASRSGRSYAVRDTEVVSGTHIIADLTLDLGKVVHDYLA